MRPVSSLARPAAVDLYILQTGIAQKISLINGETLNLFEKNIKTMACRNTGGENVVRDLNLVIREYL